MESPNYVLKTNEAVLMPVQPSKIPNVVRKGVWVILGVIVLGSLILQVNLFGELSLPVKILLLGLVLVALFTGPKKDYQPSEMELRFYDDHLILYRPKRYYSDSVSRMEICEMKYSDITKCSYKTRSGRIHFYGNGTTTWYNFKKDGSLPIKPTKVNQYKGGLLYFSTKCAPDVDFVREIEANSPLHVVEEND